MKKGGTKKKQAQKENKNPKISKSWIFFGVIVLLLAGFVLYQKVIIPNQEKAKFEKEKKVQLEIGNLLSKDTVKSSYCDYSTPNEIEGKKLFCRVSTAYYSSKEKNTENQIESQIKLILEKHKAKSVRKISSIDPNVISDLYSFRIPSSNLECQAIFNYPAKEPGYYLGETIEDDSFLQTIITCSSQTKNKIY